MRRWHRALQAVALLVISLTVAAHPFVRALALVHNPAAAAADVQMVICTSHGPVLIDAPAGTPPPRQESAACPWCALGGGSAGKLPVLLSAEIGVLDLPLRLNAVMAAAPSSAPCLRANWPAHAPRGPPGSCGA